MDFRQFRRDPAKVQAACKEGNDGSVIALKKTVIYVPERYVEKQLAVIGAQTFIVGVFAQVVDDAYAVFLGAAMVQVEPTSIATVKFGDETYLELSFDPGARVIVTQEVVQDKILTYRMYDEFISKGHAPWFLSYDDKIQVLFTSDELAGVKLMENHAMLELNAAATCRDPADINRYYRHGITDFHYVDTKAPINIPLMSVAYGTTNTVSRLMGSYWDQGVDSALVNPSSEVENIERLLRS